MRKHGNKASARQYRTSQLVDYYIKQSQDRLRIARRDTYQVSATKPLPRVEVEIHAANDCGFYGCMQFGCLNPRIPGDYYCNMHYGG